MKKFFSEFGAFISKGNALDLAVGIIIGGAFNKIISSLVRDLIMPLVGLLFRTDVTHWIWAMKGTAVWDPLTSAYQLSEDAVVMYYGNFIQSLIDFLIVAFVIFIVVKILGRLRGQLEAAKQVLTVKTEAKKVEKN